MRPAPLAFIAVAMLAAATALADTPPGATVITTREGLAAIADDLAGSYALGADIDLAGCDWTPIGNDATPFVGTFHGCGHRIENMVCTNSPTSPCRGLFGKTSGATLDGIAVSGTVAGSQFVGGLVGDADATAINCCTANMEVVVSTNSWGGGLVGRARGVTTIAGCRAAGSVTALTLSNTSGKNMGGLVGGIESGVFEIRDCVSSAEVVAGEYVGGFVGFVSADHAEISGCRADGYAGGAGNVGGFVGCIGGTGTVFVTNCVARGDVRSTYNNYGGFIGWANDNHATNIDCWCSGAVWGKGGNVGAFVGYSQRGTNLNCSVSLYGPGPRYFSGSQTNLLFVPLTAADLSARTNGWPKVKKHTRGATPISNAEELRAVTNNLAGRYVLTRDIDLDGQSVEPIGNAKAPFTGEFYGQNHLIAGFSVETTEPYAGLFGNIAGGRVNGVRAEGCVSRSQDTNAVVAVGGFAGVIQSKSMVDDCSFAGEVSNKSGGNTGGFVGRTDDSPSILRCCAPDIWVKNDSRQPDTGGFVGDHGHGFIVDAYALGEVTGFTNCVGGFAGFVGPAARIATSWCSCGVGTQGAWLGTFVGQAYGKGLITDSYYDTIQYGDRLLAAGNGSAGGSAAYAGITGVADMDNQDSFKGLDFAATWIMYEDVPFLRVFQPTAFQLWLEESELPTDADPLEVVCGVPLIARYVYGIEPTATTNADGHPLVDFKMGGDGAPVFELAPQKRSGDFGLVFSMLWSRSLSPWETVGEIRFDADGDGDDALCHPPIGASDEPCLFFRYRLVLEDE